VATVTQKERILQLLSDGDYHSTLELHAICWRYGARLWDLRQEGHALEKRRTADPAIEEWRLLGVPESPGSRWKVGPGTARHRLDRGRRPARPCASGSARVGQPVPAEDITATQGRLL